MHILERKLPPVVRFPLYFLSKNYEFRGKCLWRSHFVCTPFVKGLHFREIPPQDITFHVFSLVESIKNEINYKIWELISSDHLNLSKNWVFMRRSKVCKMQVTKTRLIEIHVVSVQVQSILCVPILVCIKGIVDWWCCWCCWCCWYCWYLDPDRIRIQIQIQIRIWIQIWIQIRIRIQTRIQISRSGPRSGS